MWYFYILQQHVSTIPEKFITQMLIGHIKKKHETIQSELWLLKHACEVDIS